MSAYRCVICRRAMRQPAATVTRAGVVAHLGPKCAAALPALAWPKKDKPRKKARITRGGRRSAEQLDWVNQLEGESYAT